MTKQATPGSGQKMPEEKKELHRAIAHFNWLDQPGLRAMSDQERRISVLVKAAKKLVAFDLTSEASSGWQDIESAPHMEKVILGWWHWSSGEFEQEIGYYSTGQRYENGYSSMSYHGQAKVWRPLLPAPPSDMQKDGEE